MSSKTILFISTHLINKAIISEYCKMSGMRNFDCILVIDNTKLQFPVLKGSPITYLNFYGKNIKCFLFDRKLNENLGLPMLAAHIDEPEFEDVMWANADYRFVYVRKFFPNYNYYWQFDYDVFCNGKTYKTFLNKYNKRKDDLIICNFRPESRSSEWCWVNGIEWVYANQQLYGSFFPVCRMTGRAIDFLYKKRLHYASIYKQKFSIENRWPLCELFVPTELANNEFFCSTISENTIHLSPYNLNEERLIERPDKKLYHPVKSNNDLNALYYPDIKKYSIWQKIFSVSNIYKDLKKYKRIYLMFFKINITCDRFHF